MISNTRAVGLAIKELRKKQNVTGEELGRRTGLSQSKISKIETGFYARLEYAKIEKILNILGASSTIRQQLLNSVNESTQSAGLQPFGSVKSAHITNDLLRRARLMRIYKAHAIPALLQTAEYRAASLKFKGYSNDQIKIAMRQTLKRQDLLWEDGRKLHVIIPQAALYTFAASKRTQLSQLDRLERVSSLSNIKLGIIPVESGLLFIENSSFVICDESALILALARYDITSHDKQDIATHDKVFKSFERLADYGDDAVRLIRSAMDYFS